MPYSRGTRFQSSTSDAARQSPGPSWSGTLALDNLRTLSYTWIVVLMVAGEYSICGKLTGRQ